MLNLQSISSPETPCRFNMASLRSLVRAVMRFHMACRSILTIFFIMDCTVYIDSIHAGNKENCTKAYIVG